MGGAGAVPDFTPFFQRAKDKKPDVFFVFVPAGDHASAVAKTYGALGMRAAGIKLIGPGDITQDTKLQAWVRPRSASSPCTTTPPICANAGEQDVRGPGRRTTAPIRRRTSCRSAATTAWPSSRTRSRPPREDGRGRRRWPALKGWKFDGPQGPILIDPDNPRHHHERISVRSRDGTVTAGSTQKVLATIENVKDACKELKIGPCNDAPKNVRRERAKCVPIRLGRRQSRRPRRCHGSQRKAGARSVIFGIDVVSMLLGGFSAGMVLFIVSVGSIRHHGFHGLRQPRPWRVRHARRLRHRAVDEHLGPWLRAGAGARFRRHRRRQHRSSSGCSLFAGFIARANSTRCCSPSAWCSFLIAAVTLIVGPENQPLTLPSMAARPTQSRHLRLPHLQHLSDRGGAR